MYVVQELDGSVLKQPVAWKRMKSYVPQQGLEPVVLAPRWLSSVDEIKEDLLKDNRDELQVMIAHVNKIKSDLSWLSWYTSSASSACPRPSLIISDSIRLHSGVTPMHTV